MKNILYFGTFFVAFCFLLAGNGYSQKSTTSARLKSSVSSNPGVFKQKTKSEEKVNPDFSFQTVKASGFGQTLPNYVSLVPYKPIPFSFPAGLKSNSPRLPHLVLKSSASTGLPVSIEGPTGAGNLSGRVEEGAVRKEAGAYLHSLREMLRMDRPEEAFELSSYETEPGNSVHVRMKQVHNGIPVYGAEVILHSKNGVFEFFNGRYFPQPELPTITPVVPASVAASIAEGDLDAKGVFRPLTDDEKELLDYDQPLAELVIYHKDRNPLKERLAWHMTVRPNFLERYEYFIDGMTGEIIHHFDNTCKDGPFTANALDLNGVSRQIRTYQVGSTYYLLDGSRAMFNLGQSVLPDNPVRAIWTINAGNTNPQNNNFGASQVTSANNNWSNPTAVSAHFNAGAAYEYYLNTHGRNSINGSGGRIISVINVSDANGGGFDNAFWNGAAMFYGNGDVAFSPLAKSMDVAGHEMTHGVVQNTANLEYQGESGAINESMADIFGAMMDRTDWKIGEDIVNLAYFPSGALRDLSDPHNGATGLGQNGWQPNHTSEQYLGTDDNGGVHTNSGISNHAFYLFADVQGKAKGEAIWYRALKLYLVASSQFIDLRIAIIRAAGDLYGAGAEVNAVKSAFDGVGILDGTGGNHFGDLPVNPGQDYILSLDVNPADVNTLYLSSTTGTNYVAKSTTHLKAKPSITDNGSDAVFVGTDSKLRSLDPVNAPNEGIIQNQPMWDNVVVSKDGNRIAAITTSVDSSIYIYDFGLGAWGRFYLYNPTFTQGATTGGVLYADAMDFDFSGEYLMYDAYNVINNPTGGDVTYWDVGFIKVWDLGGNTWGDGTVSKLFSTLPEGVSIGNPVFSKNSPYIIAFDYFDFQSGDVAVLAANLETGDVSTVFNNYLLGNPCFSKNDDKILFTALDGNNDTVCAVISLQADKITPNGTASIVIPVAKWGVWFSTGNRQLQIGFEDGLEQIVGLDLYPNPFSNGFSLSVNLEKPENYHVEIFDLNGRTVWVSGEKFGNPGANRLEVNMPGIPAGTYFCRVIAGSTVKTLKALKLN